jgi:hypothetical protein
MDAELMTIFSNINSLVDQAKQMLGGESQGGQPPQAQPEVAEKIMKFLKEMDAPKEEDDKEEALKKSDDEDEDDKEEVKKAAPEQLSTQDAGTTATDSAKEKVGEVGEVNEKNINEIARSIAGMLVKKSKSVHKSNDSELYSVLKAIVAEQSEVKKSVENILAGLGVAEQVKKINEIAKSQDSRRPLNDQNEIQKSLDYIKSELGVRDNRPVGNSGESVHKSLADALSNMVNK